MKLMHIIHIIAISVFVSFTPLNVNGEGSKFLFPRLKAVDSLEKLVSDEKECLIKKDIGALD